MIQSTFAHRISDLNAQDADYTGRVVDSLISHARDARASDIHLVPAEESFDVFHRVDGVLCPVHQFEKDFGPKLTARLKVLAGLLTYRTDVPQEGRLGTVARSAVSNETNSSWFRRKNSAPSNAKSTANQSDSGAVRLSVFPTIFGEKSVLRMFADTGHFEGIADLQLPTEVQDSLLAHLQQTSGLVLIAGPAGSGKTTTAYACLREIRDKSRAARSLVSLEDPVEVVVSGVSQTQVNEASGMDMNQGLRSLLRQDPEVILVGEIRDQHTAATVFQAALTGHLVVSTIHASSAAEALSRLSDMGIEHYVLRSGIRSIISQRLLRQKCDCPSNDSDQACPTCNGTGFSGRFVVAEYLSPQTDKIGQSLVQNADTRRIAEVAVEAGMTPLKVQAARAVEQSLTTTEELIRVFGMTHD